MFDLLYEYYFDDSYIHIGTYHISIFASNYIFHGLIYKYNQRNYALLMILIHSILLSYQIISHSKLLFYLEHITYQTDDQQN